MGKITDDKALKLTVDSDGIVWFIEGDGRPTSSGMKTDDFLGHSNVLQEADNVRLPGTHSNAYLIYKLFCRKIDQKLKSVEVCSPLCCDDPEERADPRVFLFQMRQWDHAASCGGFHQFTLEKDLSSYMLADHFFQSDEATDQTRQMTIAHPLWPLLSFVDGIEPDAAGRLIALIVDPRWYVDVNKPDSTDRWDEFLGLSYKGCAHANTPGAHWRTCPAKAVADCWKNNNFKPGMKFSNPRQFVWRAWADKGGGHKGDAAAGALFMSFVRQVWLSTVFVGYQPERLFVPNFFFQKPDELECFLAHAAKVTPKPPKDDSDEH